MEWQFRLNWQAIVEEAKQRRKRQRLTQAKLALLAEISTPTVSRFESGDTDIQLSTVLKVLSVLGMTDKHNLVFETETAFYDSVRDLVLFVGKDRDKIIRCAISVEALKDHFKKNHKNPLKIFANNREQIEHEARHKYLALKFEEDGSIIVKTEDIHI